MAEEKALQYRGFMLHMTHYDPRWCKRKSREKPMSMDVALEALEAMAEAGLNLLVIDCADGVKYKTHPDLARPYTVPMADLRKLANRAHKLGIDVVPKLNFAMSPLHQHNQWFRPWRNYWDDETYWEHAFQLIDELIAVCKPEAFFHIGMDEDHDRTIEEFAAAICTLHDGLEERNLRTVMWKDWQMYPGGRVHREKSYLAEKKIPRDVVQLLWNYRYALPDVIRRLSRKGFEVWGAPGWELEQVEEWKRDLLKYGATGMLLTKWVPCRPGNRRDILKLIRECGPVMGGE